jgi:hypothetical protein
VIAPTSGSVDHGYHMPKPEANAERIDWRAPQDREQKPRELRWTCDCRATVYTLISGGGQMFIRRDPRTGERAETERMPYAQAEALWKDLMSGKAI